MKVVMLKKMDQTGFTLIEIIIAMAIASALGSIVFTGQQAIRGQAQFSDGVERMKNNLTGIMNEANTTVITKAGGGAGRNLTGEQAVGKLVMFQAGSSTMRVWTLVADANFLTLRTEDEYTIQTPWNVRVDGLGSDQYIAFLRDPGDGLLQIYAPPSGRFDATRPSSYSPAAAQATATISLTDDDGHYGSIIVEAARNSIRRNIR